MRGKRRAGNSRNNERTVDTFIATARRQENHDGQEQRGQRVLKWTTRTTDKTGLPAHNQSPDYHVVLARGQKTYPYTRREGRRRRAAGRAANWNEKGRDKKGRNLKPQAAKNGTQVREMLREM